jgi:hypothetical protein
MSARKNSMGTAPFYRTSRGMDEALKAGLVATACSVLILAIVFLAIHAAPIGIG